MSRTKSQNNGLLDAALEAITSHPKNLLIFMLMVAGMLVSVLGVCLGLMIFIIGRIFPKTLKWIMLTGAVLVLGSWFIDGVTLKVLHNQNKYLITHLIHGYWVPSFYIWLSAMPYALLFGAGLSWISQWQVGHLQQEIKRIGSGRLHKDGKNIHPKRIQRIFNQLPHAAYADGTILGVNQQTEKYAVLKDSDANLHTLAIGTTGSGKTTTLGNIIESTILRKFPLFFIDGKGDLELAHRIEAFARANQRPFYLFSMVGESLKYNPIAFGGVTSKKDRIVELRTWSEDHYRKLAEGYLQTAFKVLNDLNVVVDLNLLAKYLNPEMLCKLAHDNQSDNVSLLSIESLQSKYKETQSLVAEIENLVNSEIGHLFDCSSGEVITLDRVLQESGIVYFCLQPLAFPAYAELLGKLIINDLKALVASQLQRTEKMKIYTIFDDFSVFAGDQIMNLLNQGRGAGVHAIVSTQSLSDLTRKGGEALLGQLLNNTNNYIIQRQNNPSDAEILSNIIGTKDDFQITSQVSSSQGDSPIGSVRRVKVFIIHPDEIKRLGLGEAILVNKQCFQVQKIILRKGKI